MTGYEFLELLNELDPELINEANRPKARRVLPFALAAAACAALGLGIFFAVRHTAVPAEETAQASPAPTVSSEALAVRRPTAAPQIEVSDEGCLVEGWGFEMAAQIEPMIFEGVCEESSLTHTGMTDAGSDKEVIGLPAEVRVGRVFRGELEEGALIAVHSETERLSPGDRCIIFGTPMASVYSGEGLYCAVDAMIKDTGSPVNVYGLDDIRGMEYGDVKQMLAQLVSTLPFTGSSEVIGRYCDSDDPKELCDYSDCIALVTMESVIDNSVKDRTHYLCCVDKCYKGKAEGTIRVIAFKDGMEPGKQYIVLLLKDQSAISYTMSSVHSLIPAGSEEAEAVLRIVG